MTKSAVLAADLAALQSKSTEMAAKVRDAIIQSRKPLATEAAAWIRREMDSVISADPAKTQALGATRLRSLKDRVNKLVESMPAVVAQLTSDDAGDVRCVPDQDDSYFESVFRTAISGLGGILEEFGLMPNRGGIRLWDPTGTKGQFRYAIGHGFNPRSTPIISECLTLMAQHSNANESVRRKAEEVEKAKARELWESA